MIWLPDSYLNLLIEEDLYLIDLTSTSLELNKYSGQLLAQAKKETMVAGVEAAARMFELAGVKAQILVHSGKIAKAGETLLKLEGRADRLHAVYKAAQNLMEYSSSIAQRCHKMLTKARLGNPKVELAVTRKHFPGTKRLSLSAALAGGATVHRQGLSDSVLVFDQHREFLGGFEEFLKFIPLLKERNLEKKIAVEISSLDQAEKALQAGAEIVQCERFSFLELEKTVKSLKSLNPEVLVIAAGGLNESNAERAALTGVDILVSSWPYFGNPEDIKMVFQKI